MTASNEAIWESRRPGSDMGEEAAVEGLSTAGGHAGAMLTEQGADEGDIAGAGTDEGGADEQGDH